MKIISWNSNGHFSERFPAILEEDADIYVIQECENPLIIDSDRYADFASVDSNSISIPISLPNMFRFSSSDNHLVKSFASCFQTERKSLIFSNLPNFIVTPLV